MYFRINVVYFCRKPWAVLGLGGFAMAINAHHQLICPFLSTILTYLTSSLSARDGIGLVLQLWLEKVKMRSLLTTKQNSSSHLLVELNHLSLANRIIVNAKCNISTPPHMIFLHPISLWRSHPMHMKWQFPYVDVLCQSDLKLGDSPIFFKNSWAQIGRRLLPSAAGPPWPEALLGFRAHKLDKKSNFPVGLLACECSQTHCFFSGEVDFYAWWCKWADKGTVGLWPSCLLSHHGQVGLFKYLTIFFLLFLATCMTGLFWTWVLAELCRS